MCSETTFALRLIKKNKEENAVCFRANAGVKVEIL